MKKFGDGKEYINVLEVIDAHYSELLDLDDIFNFYKSNNPIKIILNICITGSIYSKLLAEKYSPRLDKDEFILIMNSLFNNHGIQFIRKMTVTQDTDYVIQDVASNTRKASIGRARGILITSDDLITYCYNQVKEWSSNG